MEEKIIKHNTCKECKKAITGLDGRNQLYHCYDCLYESMYKNCECCDKKIHCNFNSGSLIHSLEGHLPSTKFIYFKAIMERGMLCYNCSLECANMILEKFHQNKI